MRGQASLAADQRKMLRMLRATPAVGPFGLLLRDLRIAVGLSQNLLARQAGVDAAYINRLERSRAAPSRGVVLAIWDALLTEGEVARPLHITTRTRERLLVAAGLVPEVIVQAGGWDEYLDRISAAVSDAAVGGTVSDSPGTMKTG